MKKTSLIAYGCDIWIDTDNEEIVEFFESSMKLLQKEAYGADASRLKAIGRVAER